eukprot:scaffold22961_cov50-Prasinocladus_malaysianus.AAC.1
MGGQTAWPASTQPGIISHLGMQPTANVGGDELVENVKVIMEVETGVPIASQHILFNGTPLENRLAYPPRWVMC